MKITEQLLELPLMQGMSRSDLNEVVAQTKIGFLKIAKGDDVIVEGAPCTHLYLLVSGSLWVESHSDDRSYSIVEEMAAPNILQPECIFGMTQRYTKTFRAITDCSFIRLEKSEVLRLSTEYMIFRINLLNIICTQSQRSLRIPWRVPAQGIRNKIARFVELHSIRPAGRKEVVVKMEDLAKMIGESRLNLSRELNRMHEEGVIDISRGRFVVHALEKLRD